MARVLFSALPHRLEVRHRFLTGLARHFYFRAAELGCKCACHYRTGEIPAQAIAAPIAATEPYTCLDASRTVEMVHGIQLRTETARRHDNLHDMRKFSLDSFLARATFVTSHVRKYRQRRFGLSPGRRPNVVVVVRPIVA